VYKKASLVSEDDAQQDGYVSPNNPDEVPIRPIDMPNNGAYPNS
jgi:hypothetical protein